MNHYSKMRLENKELNEGAPESEDSRTPKAC